MGSANTSLMYVYPLIDTLFMMYAVHHIAVERVKYNLLVYFLQWVRDTRLVSAVGLGILYDDLIRSDFA